MALQLLNMARIAGLPRQILIICSFLALLFFLPKVDAAAGGVATDANDCQEKGAGTAAVIRSTAVGQTNVGAATNPPSPWAANRDLCIDTLAPTATNANPCKSLFGATADLMGQAIVVSGTAGVDAFIALITAGAANRNPDVMRQKACDEALPGGATRKFLCFSLFYSHLTDIPISCSNSRVEPY
jgi:hypothetical protein